MGVRERIGEVVSDLFEFYDPWSDVQVLAPMKRGATGTRALNAALQDLLNPSPDKIEDPEERKVFARPGDRVMQLSNDYEVGVFNGMWDWSTTSCATVRLWAGLL